MEQIKTIFFLSILSIIFVTVGFSFLGNGGALIALTGAMNFYAYYYSDKQVLKHYEAEELPLSLYIELYFV